MQIQQFFIVLIFLLVLLFVWNLYLINTRILCRITKRDRTVKKKWAKPINDERIVWGTGWYYVKTDRIKYDSLFFGLLPVRVLDFTYGRKYPIDPATGYVDEETPEERANLDRREAIEAWNLGTQRAMGKTKVGITSGGWLPIALVVGLVACLYLIFQMRGQIDSVGNALNVLQEMMMKSGMLK